MATNTQKLLFCFLLLNVTLVIVNFSGAGQNLRDHSKKTSLRTLTVLNATNGSQSLLRGSHKATSSLEDPTHPFDLLPKKLEELEWNPERIDEMVRKHWKTERTFLRPQADEKTKEIRTILSTSCLHNAAWIVTGLLELQTRPNYYKGVYKRPEDKALIVYDNTKMPRSPDAAAVTESLRSFIDSRPSDEPIVLQVDMYQSEDLPSTAYIDHHFALHVYKGQVDLYHGWQHLFNLIDWMKQPGMHDIRYPMPLETFLDLFEKALNHTEDYFDRERLEANWKVFGITNTFVYGKKEVLDPVVRALRYPQIVPLITHWPNPQTHSSAVKSL